MRPHLRGLFRSKPLSHGLGFFLQLSSFLRLAACFGSLNAELYASALAGEISASHTSLRRACASDHECRDDQKRLPWTRGEKGSWDGGVYGYNMVAVALQLFYFGGDGSGRGEMSSGFSGRPLKFGELRIKTGRRISAPTWRDFVSASESFRLGSQHRCQSTRPAGNAFANRATREETIERGHGVLSCCAPLPVRSFGLRQMSCRMLWSSCLS
eukprot:scaffold8288_cov30-Tisochrysis_lutea.AAC.2